ncbi:DUF4305 domain-containing protein [Marinilactibacillus kalidii]|uniref:DUF4305 domain-containing protein n=1 Tax=Marinilactibacillus kalidii TaxID=2820274 RepID=UPI001ABEE548|nr:DUF4305 domain-containing protein [Marinilactibacillus kalidii]
MTNKQMITYITFKFVMFALLLYLSINAVQTNGWGLFPLIFVFLATRDFVQGTRLLQVYYKVKKNYKA